jgi:hypothetical protein
MNGPIAAHRQALIEVWQADQDERKQGLQGILMHQCASSTSSTKGVMNEVAFALGEPMFGVVTVRSSRPRSTRTKTRRVS